MLKRLFGILTIVTLLILVMLTGWYLLGPYATKIRLSGGSIPTFKVSGRGEMVNLTIHGPRQRPGEEEAAWIVWKLVPIRFTGELDDLNAIGSIKYGEVPKGYRQIYPENNAPPPPLVEGHHYWMGIFTNEAPWGQIAFELRGEKVVELPIN